MVVRGMVRLLRQSQQRLHVDEELLGVGLCGQSALADALGSGAGDRGQVEQGVPGAVLTRPGTVGTAQFW